MIHERKAKSPPPRQIVPDGTVFSFWFPRKGTTGRRAAAWSCGLGASVTFPDGRVEHTWGRNLNAIYRDAFGHTLTSLVERIDGTEKVWRA